MARRTAAKASVASFARIFEAYWSAMPERPAFVASKMNRFDICCRRYRDIPAQTGGGTAFWSRPQDGNTRARHAAHWKQTHENTTLTRDRARVQQLTCHSGAGCEPVGNDVNQDSSARRAAWYSCCSSNFPSVAALLSPLAPRSRSPLADDVGVRPPEMACGAASVALVPRGSE